ncbi:M50 family metallopeptidase [Paenibacillus sp. CAU 1782]
MFSWFRTGIILVVALILTRFVPFSAFFRNVNTLVHELSHALAALLLQGSVMQIHLYANQSGVTVTRFQENWMMIPIALAGYIGASLFSMLLFQLYAGGRLKTGLVIVAILSGLGLILFVRNGYGMAWSAGFTVITALIAFMAPLWLQKGYYLLIAFLCLVESVVSSFVIFYLSLTQPGFAGDATSLSRSAFLPALVWGLLFVVVSLWCARVSLSTMFRRRRQQSLQM